MHSAAHRANILNPTMTTIGVGLVRRGGYYYAVEDFADGVAQLGPEQIEQKIATNTATTRATACGLYPGCPPDLRNGARFCRRFFAPVHHALGGKRFEPFAAGAGTKNRKWAVSQSGGGCLRFRQSQPGFHHVQGCRDALLTKRGMALRRRPRISSSSTSFRRPQLRKETVLPSRMSVFLPQVSKAAPTPATPEIAVGSTSPTTA